MEPPLSADHRSELQAIYLGYQLLPFQPLRDKPSRTPAISDHLSSLHLTFFLLLGWLRSAAPNLQENIQLKDRRDRQQKIFSSLIPLTFVVLFLISRSPSNASISKTR